MEESSGIDNLRRWDREHVWHAFTQMAEYEPFIIERAQGCTLTDVYGRQYLDGVSSLWCNLHGHCHPLLDEAVRQQLAKVSHVTSLGSSNPTTIRLAKRLTELAPPGLNHVFFSGDGSSSVEVALKMAFQYWRQTSSPNGNKTKFVAFEGAYHGDTLGSVSVGGVARFHDMFRPLLFDVVRLPIPDTYRLPSDVAESDALSYYLGLLEATLASRHGEIAAVVIEPLVQCAAGMVRHPMGFLRGVFELTRRYEVLLIADEVAVGFGRTGTMFACEQEQVSPDLLCLGKGITGGYLAMSATLATDRIYTAFLGTHSQMKTFFHGHSYGGNPLASAAALASLEVFEKEQTLEKLQPKIARLAAHLERIATLSVVGSVRQLGLISGIELVANRQTKEPLPWGENRGGRVCRRALECGVWIRPLGNVIVVMPPLSVTLDELDQICEAVEDGIRKAE